MLDLGGRQVALSAPVDVAAVAGVAEGFGIHRVIANGQISLTAGSAWDSASVTSQASYSMGQATKLTAVANVAQIEIGARVSGAGVGREVYVTAKNVGAGKVTLSQPLW